MSHHDSLPFALPVAIRALSCGQRTEFPRDRGIARVFEEQVRRAPDAIALRFEGQDTSYRELNRQANRLARRLRNCGVGVDTPVGILVDQSPAVVVAFIAILKAGGAYVPLDPQHPASRLAQMIEDARPTVLLGDREAAAQYRFTGVCIEYPGPDHEAPTDAGDDDDVHGGAGPEDLAHVLFTSGSTGQPKGACILQRGVLRLVLDTDWVRFGPGDRVAQVGSFSFDIATVEVWGALLHGACLCIIPRDVLLSPAALARTLADERISFLLLSTPLLHRLASIVPGAFAGVRTLVVGGDVLDPKWAREVFAAGKPERFVNIYGPTECTTCSTWFELKAPPELAASIPIGRPLANTAVYVLDEQLAPVAIGEPGEVWIGGEGVGRGYLNRPELTAERFVDDPFTADPAARLYRTGDRARWLPDGDLEFLGRVDNQVKVRGFRIELGEIEGALRAHASVGDAIVRAREDAAGDKKLVAYVSPRPGHSVEVAALREHLGQRLPAYMIPHAFVALAELPLNAHGKVDPRKLPAPRFEADERLAPRSALEASLARIWADVLGLAEVGVHDRFLDHGGDSLLALSLIDQVHRDHGVVLSARAVFEAATIEGLARAVEAAHSAGDSAATVAVTPADRSRPRPLSFAEQQLWFLVQTAPDSAFYNEPFTLHLPADTDPALLERALRRVVERHEILRTTYALTNDGPVRVVHAALPPTLAREDLRALPAALREARAQELATRDARAIFDLDRGPLLRATFVRLDDAACRLSLVLHHIVMDGLSLAIFLRELEVCHAALAAGRDPELAPLSLQYADFAAWQTDARQRRASAPHLEYWTARLRGVGALELPVLRPRPATPSHRGARHYLHIPAALVADVKELGRSAGATPFMTFLALYGALLHRTSGSDDFAVGAGFSGRGRPELAPIVGMFVNLLPIRLRAAADLPLRDLLAAVRTACLEAFEHDAPLPTILEAVNPERHADINPLFQALFTLDPPLTTPDSAWRLEPFETDTGATKLDLSFALAERPDGILVRIEYATDLFDACQIEAMAGHYLELLRGATRQPDAPLAGLPLLTGPETAQLLAWSRGPAVEAKAEALHRLFEQQVMRSPDAPAAVFEDRGLTYRELNAAANRLARHLRGLGIGAGDMVGVCVERSLDMVVGVLGILKAGAAYVPLDASYPPARLGFILEDTRLRWVVGETSTRLRVAGSATVLCLDELRDVLAALSGDDLEVPVAVDDLAYVIYTSGSTGTPKGALIEHRNAYHLCRNVAGPLGFAPGLQVLQFARLGFDASVFEIFMTLASGGTIHLAPQRALIPGFELVELLARRRIGFVCLPPSALAMLPRRALPDLRIVVAAGEDCPQELVDAWAPGRRFINAYGPTETTVLATFDECVAGRKPTIGRPNAGAEAYVLDAARQLVPVGVPGELYIGGTGLSRGYLRRPELQAERFVAVPSVGATLYRTGDRVRRLPGGELEFLGRLDHQIKLRGFRIELGEIEAALRQHPGVLDAVVVVQTIAGDRRLVGYVAAPADAREGLPRGLQERLRGRLPDYMVPGEIVVMDALPLGPNDKLDRKALPLPERWARPAAERPMAGTQEVLAGIWRRVLGVAEVGLRDGFFDLGGSSLLLARVQADIAAALGVRPSMATLFQFPTLEALTRHLDGEAGPAHDERPADVAPAPRTGGIAIIGMAGRFPGAPDVDALWTLLVAGKEGLTRVDEPADDPAYVRAAGLLDGADTFDAEFFGYTPKDARLTDPQQRLFLECAWEALERAGYDARRLGGKAGVFAGSGVPRYWLEQVALHGSGAPTAAWYQAILGNPWQFLATTTAYKLGLRGPALTVQTACSTSLVAVHMACQSLQTGECDVALAGGVSLATLGEVGYAYEEGSILSPDGRCRPFDARAGGTVPASGVGVVVLKRLEQALADGDTIHAVIRGSAINNDGDDKIGFTAPGVQGQREVIAAAQAAAGVRPQDIGFVEAHGTATPLGDPIEVQALRLAFGAAPGGAPYCALGSLKSNLGHLDAAAGVAGLIKATLALEHAYLPGTLHFERENPELQLAGSPFHVRREGAPWVTPAGVLRRAGVSSFGLGGTNAHVILEQAPAAPTRAQASEPALLVLSTRHEAGIDAASRRLGEHLENHPTQSLADVAFTLQQGRAAHPHRRAVVCRSAQEAPLALAAPAPIRRAPPRAPEVVFMFPGGGSQRVGMGAGLYRSEPVYREALDRCADLFARELGGDLRALLFPPAPARDAAAAQLRAPSWNMASVFATEYALAQLLAAWGVRPAAMIGHSLGEYTAATLAGILALEDAAALVALRGRLCDAMPASAMLVVPLPPHELTPLLGEGLALAAINGPKHVVVSGLARAIDDLEAQLQRRGVQTHRLQLAGGFHSPLVEPAMGPLTDRAATMRLRAPTLPVMSNVTADWMGDDDARDPGYWARHMRQTVRFSEGLARVLQTPGRILLEVGPGKSLATLAQLHPAAGPQSVIVSALGDRAADDDRAALLEAIGELWCAGVEIDWAAHHGGASRRRVPLPTYPFARQRHMLDRTPARRPEPILVDLPRPVPAPEAPALPVATERVLATLWEELLGVEAAQLGAGSDFFDLGGTSLLAVQMIRALKERLHVPLTAHAILEHRTLGALVRAVDEARPRPHRRRPNPLLIRLQEGAPGQTPLILVQPIGGTVYTYMALARELGADRPVHAFRALGLEDGEVPFDSIPEMARAYVEELLGLQPAGPYLLGGHSSGGVIAYEMAVELLARGHAVERVIQVDTVTVEQSRRHGVRNMHDAVRLVESFTAVSSQLATSLLVAMRSDPRLGEVILATNKALSHYQPARLAVPIVYLRARERDSVLDPHADVWWRAQTAGSFESHDVPGDHFSVMEDPHVVEVARVLRDRLEPVRPEITRQPPVAANRQARGVA